MHAKFPTYFAGCIICGIPLTVLLSDLDMFKVYSSHLNRGARLDSFDPLLNSKYPANFKKFFNDTISREEHITN
jgi:hypothetical protein